MNRLTLACLLAAIASCALDGQSPSCQALTSQTVRIQRGAEKGAGVVLRSDGRTVWIATAKHILIGQGDILVQFAGDGGSFIASLEYPRLDSLTTLDLAVVKVRNELGGIPKAPPATPRLSELQAGERVSYVGHPMGVNWQCYLNKDVITRLSYKEDDRLFLFSNPTVREGLSGGPVFDQQGSLIGLVSGESSTKDSVAVRITSVLRIMTDELRVDLDPSAPLLSTDEATDEGFQDSSEARSPRSRWRSFGCFGLGELSRTEGPFVVSLLKCTSSGSTVKCDLKVFNNSPERARFTMWIDHARLFSRDRVYNASDALFGTSPYRPLSGHHEVEDTIPAHLGLSGWILFRSVPESSCANAIEIKVMNDSVLTFENIPLLKQSGPPAGRKQ